MKMLVIIMKWLTQSLDLKSIVSLGEIIEDKPRI